MYKQTDFKINELVARVTNGSLVLPEFQRPFIWKASQTSELLESIGRGWPIGSLLILKNEENGLQFGLRPIEGAPVPSSRPTLFLLDGQQRVTSIFRAFTSSGDRVFYVDFRSLIDGLPYVKSVNASKAAVGKFRSAEQRAAKGIAFLDDLRDEERWEEWKDWLNKQDRAEFMPVVHKYLGGFRAGGYSIPAIELGDKIEHEALARIFETINRTGVKLNAFDLIVALVSPLKRNLRDEWREFKELERFEIDPLDPLRLIALRLKLSQGRNTAGRVVSGVTQGDILGIPPAEIAASWLDACASIKQAFDYAHQNFGVTDKVSMPASAMMITLAYIIDKHSPTTISQWWWNSILSESYRQGSNTQMITDINSLSRNASAFSTITPSKRERAIGLLLEPGKLTGVLAKGVAALLSRAAGLSGSVDSQVAVNSLQWLAVASSGAVVKPSDLSAVADCFLVAGSASYTGAAGQILLQDAVARQFVLQDSHANRSVRARTLIDQMVTLGSLTDETNDLGTQDDVEDDE